MLIELNNVWSRLVQASEPERQFVQGYLSFDNAKARYAGKATFCLLHPINGVFLSGFVPLIQKNAITEGFQVSLLDRRVAPCAPDLTADLSWLRDYQRAAVMRIVERERGIIAHATGLGKSEVVIALMRILPCRWLFMVHRTSLVEQTADRFDLRALEHRTGEEPAGRIGEGRWQAGKRVTFATFQTLYEGLSRGDPRTLELLKSAQAIAVDEAHTLPSATHLKVVTATVNARWRVGLSGTPLSRGDRKSIYALGALGPIVHEVRAEEGQRRGVLAKAEIRFVPCFQTHGSRSYNTVYRDLVTRSDRRNALLVSLCQRAEKPCLLFVRETDHGRTLEKALWRAGIRCAFIYGQHSTDWRNTVHKQLERAALDVVIASVIDQEGVDLPFLRSVVIACGGESVIATLQRLGRGMRIERDTSGNVIKDSFQAFDVLDQGQRWLERHAEARKASCLEQGFSTIVES